MMAMEPKMYYGLTQMPFQKNTKYSALFKTEDAEQINRRMTYLKSVRGVGLITGNPGTGKTAAIREYAMNLNPSLFKVIYLKMSSVSVNDFLRMLAQELGLEPRYRKSDLFRQIQEEIRYLVDEKRCVPVIIIDEAQQLSNTILRDLVPLLNFDMDSKDYCILILTGLSSVNRTLKLSTNEALRQRIIVNYHTNGISKEECSGYVNYCLEQCGAQEPIFSENGIEAAWRNCQGSLRRLNTVLQRSLIEGCNQRKRIIDAEIISIAQADAELE